MQCRRPRTRPAREGSFATRSQGSGCTVGVSTGLAEASPFLLANLRARIGREIENGWSLYVADAGGQLAAMLALHLPKFYLDQLFVAPQYQGESLGRRLLAFT